MSKRKKGAIIALIVFVLIAIFVGCDNKYPGSVPNPPTNEMVFEI